MTAVDIPFFLKDDEDDSLVPSFSQPTTVPIPSNAPPHTIPINHEDDENDLRDLFQGDDDDKGGEINLGDVFYDKDYFKRRLMEYEKNYEEAAELISKQLVNVSEELELAFEKPSLPSDDFPPDSIVPYDSNKFLVQRKEGSEVICFVTRFNLHKYMHAKVGDRQWYVNISGSLRSLVVSDKPKRDLENGFIYFTVGVDMAAVRCPVPPSKNDMTNHSKDKMKEIKSKLFTVTTTTTGTSSKSEPTTKQQYRVSCGCTGMVDGIMSGIRQWEPAPPDRAVP